MSSALFGEDDKPQKLSKEERRKRKKEADEKVQKELEKQKGICFKIKEFVHESLGGTPPNYVNTYVRHLYDNYYRANVLVGTPEPDKRGVQAFRFNERTLHSFYVMFTPDGCVCEKEIPRLYDNYKAGIALEGESYVGTND